MVLGNPGMHDPVAIGAWFAVVAAATGAAVIDMRTRRIPNVLTFPLLGLGLIYSGIFGGSSGVQDALLGCLLLGIPYMLLFIFAGGGAGDAKMLGAIGAWVGFSSSIVVLICVPIAGGILALGYALVRRKAGAVGSNLRAMAMAAGLMVFCRVRVGTAQALFPEQSRMLRMPYGISILTGTLIAAGWVLLCG
jgi:prepilin peptidase CpaA